MEGDIVMNQKAKQYHIRQYQHIYRSTEVFVEWLENKGFFAGKKNKILDMACGAGANMLYMANRHENIHFVGMDIEQDCIDYANQMLEECSKYKNCTFNREDWFKIDSKWLNEFDGVISLQSILMFPDYRDALSKLADLNPDWIAFSSLFYEGEIEYVNRIRNYYRPLNGKEYTEYYYNIFSIIRCREFMKELGYHNFEYMPYEIDIDIPKADNMDGGTYTVNTAEGKRIQISGALMMPWYFVVAYK